MKRICPVLLCMGLVAGGAVYFNRVVRPQALAQIAAASTPPPPLVPVTEARLVHRPVRLVSIGTVVAAHQVAIGPEVGGRVTDIFFDSGARVQAGTPLVQLNDAQDQADVAGFQAQIELAGREFGRAMELARHDFGPVKTVDETRAQLRQAVAGLARANAAIAQKHIVAPFAGQIGLRQVEIGQYLNPGTTVAVLTDLDQLRVNFSLAERARARLRLGEPVAFTVDAYPGRVFNARLTTIDPQVGTDTRTIHLQASLDNTDHALLPGMFAEVSVQVDADHEIVAVPETAVEVTLEGEVVRVAEADPGATRPDLMQTHQVAVKTGQRFDGLVAVTEGLTPGTLVVASGQSRLIPGFAIVAKREGPRVALAHE